MWQTIGVLIMAFTGVALFLLVANILVDLVVDFLFGRR